MSLGGEGWTAFDSFVELLNPDESTYWFREVIPSGWVPFSGSTSEPRDHFSAEFYCDEDVLNYDNFDFISGVDAEEHFYCVGFNAQADVCPNDEGIQTSTEECSQPVDVCPNLEGDQNDVPEGYMLDNEGQCVLIPDDSCRPGTHEEVIVHEAPTPFAPNVCIEGYTAVDGQCVGPSSAPTCESGSYNPETNQCEDGPQDVEEPINSPAICSEGVLNGDTDMCEVEVGPSPSCPEEAPFSEGLGLCVPPGESFEETVCVPDEEEPKTDMCANMAGLQEEIPVGRVQSGNDCIHKEGGGGGRRQAPRGEVLGAATTCSPLLTQYLRMGQDNNVEEVKKLQMFLNKFVNAGLPETGFFGPSTFEWVKTFQLSNGADVLVPWVGFPGSDITSQNTPTGYVYQTTKWKINNLWCPGSESFPATLI